MTPIIAEGRVAAIRTRSSAARRPATPTRRSRRWCSSSSTRSSSSSRTAPNSPAEFPSKVGAKNVNGIFSGGDWFPQSNVARERRLRQGLPEGVRRHGRRRSTRTRRRPTRSARSPQAVAKKIALDRQQEDHRDAAQGQLADGRGRASAGTRIGEPQGSDLLVEWISGKLYRCIPRRSRCTSRSCPKPAGGIGGRLVRR